LVTATVRNQEKQSLDFTLKCIIVNKVNINIVKNSLLNIYPLQGNSIGSLKHLVTYNVLKIKHRGPNNRIPMKDNHHYWNEMSTLAISSFIMNESHE
jgi:hypothetical protein